MDVSTVAEECPSQLLCQDSPSILDISLSLEEAEVIACAPDWASVRCFAV